MYKLIEWKIKKERAKLLESYRFELFEQLDFGLMVAEELIPEATLLVGRKKLSASVVLEKRIEEIKNWVSQILRDACTPNEEDRWSVKGIPELEIPQSLSHNVFGWVLDLLSFSRDLTDLDYNFLSHLAAAMSLAPSEALAQIDQLEDDQRANFLELLMEDQGEEGSFGCALLFYQAIQADKRVDIAEVKYIESIMQLLEGDEEKLQLVKNLIKEEAPLPRLEIDRELALRLFCYLIEIVLCDQNYDVLESNFIKEAGEVLKLDPKEQEKWLTIFAERVLVKSVLFPTDETSET